MYEEIRHDLKNNVVRELKSHLENALTNISYTENIKASEIYDFLEKNDYIKITPPSYTYLMPPPESGAMYCITLDSLKNFNSGRSIKSGNIRLNIKKLINALPDAVSLGIGMSSENPIVVVCGALSLWLKLKDVATISISKEQAFVIVALWKAGNSENKILLNDGFTATNELLKQYGEPQITIKKYNNLIDSLSKMRCIELTEETILLKERISKDYIQSI